MMSGFIDVTGPSRAISTAAEIGRHGDGRNSRRGWGIGISAARQNLPG
jgi:hypothetical protein